jgi:glutathione synthase/RimK-type ligase-like ATP-grasp enzyme
VVTAREAAGLDEDEPLLLEALARAGATPDVAAWDDPDVDWGATDMAVVRSAWDYARRHDEFLAWARSTAARTRLVNPVEVLAWTTDKTYLADLSAAGVAIVPTTWLTPADLTSTHRNTADGLPGAVPHGEVVVKPAVSAGARDTARFGPDRRAGALAHARGLLEAGRTVLVQPYVEAVDAEGETALLYFGGEYSHAVRKGPLLRPGEGPSDELFAREELTPVDATRAQREAGEAVLRAQPFPVQELAYARVDLVRGPDGTPLLLELELAEPSVFLDQHPGAADRFAEVLVRG